MRFSLILSILITLFIWGNSMLPADLSGASSGFIVGLVSDVLNIIKLDVDDDTLSLIIRKLAHFTEFFFLGISLSIYFIKEKIEVYHVISLGFIVAVIDEFIQLFVSGRSGNVIDIGIDLLGILVAFSLITFLKKTTYHQT
ncbi:MAG: VanZ family protein [Acholeplasmataceae bacterium]|nr:VanZ family protein [Acholeplasmataceae bacterium]